MILIRLTSPTPMAAGSIEDLLERAVDAEADANDVLGRLDVHVGGPVAHGLGQDAGDDLDDRCVVGDDLGVIVVVSRARLREPSTASYALDQLSTPPMAR